MISMVESLLRAAALREAAEHADAAHDPEAQAVALQAMLDFPCAPHHFSLPEVWEDLGHALRSLGRFEEAIEARRSAIAAGYQSDPDPEAEIAELLLELGRRDEADRLYAELRRRDPDDVWLSNSAAWMYAAVGDHETALTWLDAGIELAMEFGDADHVLDQLTDMRRRSLAALGRSPDDEVTARAEAFLDHPQPAVRTRPRKSFVVPDEPTSCAHCGWDAGAEPQDGWWEAEPERTPNVTVAVAWFPAGEWPVARRRYRTLRDMPADPAEYNRSIEGSLRTMAEGRSGKLHIAPIRVDELEEFCEERRLEPDSRPTRAHLAAEVARTGSALPWPPGRNERCWCGSGRKYKQCCGRRG
jgi:tetratricopeptide (TPR) repeat protein